MVAETVLEVTNLLKDYGEYRAVDGISFVIKKGQGDGLLGPNGPAKAQLPNTVGHHPPHGGDIRYFGKDFRTNRQACLQRINFASAYNTLQDRLSV